MICILYTSTQCIKYILRHDDQREEEKPGDDDVFSFLLLYKINNYSRNEECNRLLTRREVMFSQWVFKDDVVGDFFFFRFRTGLDLFPLKFRVRNTVLQI